MEAEGGKTNSSLKKGGARSVKNIREVIGSVMETIGNINCTQGTTNIVRGGRGNHHCKRVLLGGKSWGFFLWG